VGKYKKRKLITTLLCISPLVCNTPLSSKAATSAMKSDKTNSTVR
jgi:hypothetical protein